MCYLSFKYRQLSAIQWMVVGTCVSVIMSDNDQLFEILFTILGSMWIATSFYESVACETCLVLYGNNCLLKAPCNPALNWPFAAKWPSENEFLICLEVDRRMIGLIKWRREGCPELKHWLTLSALTRQDIWHAHSLTYWSGEEKQVILL